MNATPDEITLRTSEAEALDQLTAQSNALFIGPDASALSCGRSMRQSITQSSAPSQLLVCIETLFESQLDLLQAHPPEATDRRVIVTAPPHDRRHDIEMAARDVDVHGVSKPTDLRRLGSVMESLLTNRNDTSWNVSVHSLSRLLDVVDDDLRVFRFVHGLTGQVRAADAHAQFYLDPSSHDERTVRTLASLFDAVFTFDADGSLSLT
ncbi:hypothetical protein C440_16901 [Haloferax mucosum ATCC BAA-1512]|uniref:Uncharacterized protein n=1 Tax=Haloferax mucosum ATCC BAA-1512 TaxID=662479 RepID=M0I358_9EURY|nr:hypothetical protein C440_16901 [Haloferax mucosum ATCC BAA-1512]